MEEKKDYRISFFKPTTPFSRTNRNMVIVLVLIWAFGVFGFQILLRIMEEPTPEKTLITFEEVWGNVEAGNGTTKEKVKFANTILAVLGKSSLAWKPEKRAVLDNALSWAVYDLMSADSLRYTFIEKVANFEERRTGENLDLKDPVYINAKIEIIEKVAPMLGVENYSLKAKLIPLELRSEGLKVFKPENKAKLHDIMKLYLTHNQSVLTNTQFLGFPFHYFYTAVFLLVMFVVLCWVYSYKIDKLHRAMGSYDKPDTAKN